MPVLSRFLKDNRRALWGFAIGMVLLCLVYLPLYPSFGADELESIYAQIPEGLRSAFGVGGLQDGIGYTQSSIFGLAGALLLLIATVSWGARAVAGDEEAGTLELTLAHPVARRRLIVERGLALLIQSCALAAAVFVCVVALSGPAKLGVAASGALAASVALALLGGAFGFAALAAGALTGRRGVAVTVGAAFAVAAYVGNAVGAQSSRFAWARKASPFEWAFGADPLRHGLDPAGALLLLAVILLLWLLAGWSLERRDVGV